MLLLQNIHKSREWTNIRQSNTNVIRGMNVREVSQLLLLYFFCFPSRSVITHKYNTSVDNTTLYLYTKIVFLLLHRAFRRITLTIDQQMHLHKISH